METQAADSGHLHSALLQGTPWVWAPEQQLGEQPPSPGQPQVPRPPLSQPRARCPWRHGTPLVAEASKPTPQLCPLHPRAACYVLGYNAQLWVVSGFLCSVSGANGAVTPSDLQTRWQLTCTASPHFWGPEAADHRIALDLALVYHRVNQAKGLGIKMWAFLVL